MFSPNSHLSGLQHVSPAQRLLADVIKPDKIRLNSRDLELMTGRHGAGPGTQMRKLEESCGDRADWSQKRRVRNAEASVSREP